MKTINDLLPGQRGVVRSLDSVGAMRRRLMDVGLIEGTRVECVGRSPAGDPSAYLIRGAVIAIRREDGRGVQIEAGGDEHGPDHEFHRAKRRGSRV